MVLPEFQDRFFEEAAPVVFGPGESSVPGMRTVSYNILRWETTGIESSTRVLFWMPFSMEDSLPGFTTRAEVSREIARAPHRIVVGMPAGALSGGHIRYHAHQAGLTMHPSLEKTVRAVLDRL